MRLKTLNTSIALNSSGTIRGRSFISLMITASILLSWITSISKIPI